MFPLALKHTRSRSYRGRLAPSPTGLLHLGHARTFLTAYARARDAHGVLVLRNEDLDQQRAKPEFVHAMIEDLEWLGIRWQEGEGLGGRYRPYTQSKRYDFYRSAWQRLRDGGFIYACKCSRKELARAASAPHENEEDEPIYPGTCRPLPVLRGLPGADTPREITKPEGVNWRFQVPHNEPVEFVDRHFGRQRFIAGRDFGDFLVWRKDNVPSYQLACVVDDAAMHITEVVRGADLLMSTARQILLYRALGLEPPAFYHCPLVTDASGQRLAKRHDALSIRRLREEGRQPRDLQLMLSGLPPELAL